MKLAIKPRSTARPPADHHLRGAILAIVALGAAFLGLAVFKLHGG